MSRDRPMNTGWRLWWAMGALMAFFLTPAFAADEANVVLHSTITGNQEQPKVMHIVPWQGPGGGDQLQQPLQPLLNDVFAPMDRGEFLRELKYREMVKEEIE